MSQFTAAVTLLMLLPLGGIPSDAEIAELRTQFAQADEQNKQQAGFALANALFQRWVKTSNADPAREEERKELQSVSDAIAGNPFTKSSYKAKSFWAETVEQSLIEGEPNEEKAKFIAKLVEPTKAHRMTDEVAKRGSPAEPFGWDVQAVYSLALARAGKLDAARTENDLVIKKISNNIEKSPRPDLGVVYLGKERANKSLLREMYLYRALIEAIGRDQAAVEKFSLAAGMVDGMNDHSVEKQQQLIAAIAKILGRGAQAK